MNILHINNVDLVGARFNGHSLSKNVPVPHKSDMLVWEKIGSDGFVHQIPPLDPWVRKMWHKSLIFSSRIGLDRLVGFGGSAIARDPIFHQADIIHLHIIHNFTNLSILSLPSLARQKPIVWTLHDAWALTGGCEHSFDCNKWKTGCNPICPYPRARSLFERFAPYLHWKVKKTIFSKVDFSIIVASKWMKKKVDSSPLLKNKTVHVVPFGINLDHYPYTLKNVAKERLGINPKNNVIALRDTGIKRDKIKGLKYLKEALEKYVPNQPTTLLIFQDGEGFDSLKQKFDIKKLGWVSPEHVPLALSAADIFVMPSIQESFGMMAIEAMACETPVITFDGTAVAENVDSSNAGLVVQTRDSMALADAIGSLLSNRQLRVRMGCCGRQVVNKKFTFDRYVQSHIKIYQSIIDANAQMD